ncbi:MAG: S1 RNA-binding domain-containing protein [Chloroflexi bacterium]|nr:MAG: S1 RNA-binding domain-containing protein [Chloroflexota bacterium]
MQTQSVLESLPDDMDFATLLEASLADSLPSRGDIVTGTVMAIDSYGLIVDIGWKRDGIVPRKDLERLQVDISEFENGREIDVMVIRLEDSEGNLILSVSQARQVEDWKNAEALMNAGELWTGTVIEANRGGLIVPFGNLRGFIPASHVADLPRGLNDEDRQREMSKLVGQDVTVKIIEVNRKRRRLVLSQRDAQRGNREARKQVLLDELNEGDVTNGVVSGLRDFGAFVDLGGADGLIHISELAWHRVEHPKEILSVGDEVDVYVLRLDNEGKRIGLSLKRLQENPWTLIDEIYHVGQLVEGVISRIADFGVFISLEPGIEALLHSSQIDNEIAPNMREGQRILTRIISIEADKQRLGLSLKEVTFEEYNPWFETQEADAVVLYSEDELAEAETTHDEDADAGAVVTDSVQSDELAETAEASAGE